MARTKSADLRAESQIATRDEILVLLSEASRKGHVGAMRLLLEEMRHDSEGSATTSSVIDELSTKRKKAAGIG